MWVQRRLARASPGVSGKGGQFEETVRGGLGVVPRGLTDAGFLRVPWTSEQQGLQQSRGPERADGRREGGAGRPSAWLWAGWVGRPRPRPEGPLATRGQWESRVPLARAEARLARCLPVSHVLPRGRRRLAPPGASRGPVAAHAGAPLRSPRLGVGNARRPLQAWCRWSALGSPVRPLRGARWFGPPSPRTRPPPRLRRCARRESRAQPRPEPAAGVRRRPALEAGWEGRGTQTAGPRGQVRVASAFGLGSESLTVDSGRAAVKKCEKQSKDKTPEPDLPRDQWTRPLGCGVDGAGTPASGFSKNTP